MPVSKMPKHTCHAPRCRKEVPPRMFMCLADWRRLPPVLQRAVWATYVPGQEITKTPSMAYLDIAFECIAFLETDDENNGLD